MVDLIVHRDSEGSDPKIDKEAGQIVMGKKFPSMYVCRQRIFVFDACSLFRPSRSNVEIMFSSRSRLNSYQTVVNTSRDLLRRSLEMQNSVVSAYNKPH